MISEKALVTDGTSTIYSVDFEIISEDHCNVLLDTVLQSSDTYDVINNAVVFHTAPTTGQNLLIRVGTTESDLAAAPTDVGIVATNITSVNTVANNIANIQAVDTNNANVTITATNIADVNTVADDITNVNTVATDITNVNAVAANQTNIDAVAGNAANINSAVANEANINSAVSNEANINSAVANEANITTVANDLNEPVSEIDTVATNIANVNSVATNEANINAAVANEANINSAVANASNINSAVTNEANINSAVANEANINAAVANATNINAAVANEADIDAAVANETNITSVATNEANINIVAGIGAAGLQGIVDNESNINSVGTDIASVITVATDIADVNTVAGISADVTAAATNTADITAVAAEVQKVVDVANDLNEATSEIDVVAGSIANVDLVGADIANVNTVAANVVNVNSFAETYFISATAPTSPTNGDLWFDISVDTMKVYGTSGWQNAGSSVNGVENSVEHTATAGQTSFTATYDPGYLNVFLNGVLLDSTDYTATDGANVVLDAPAALDDLVFIQSFGTFALADHYSKVASDARFVNLAGGTMTGDLTAPTFIGNLDGAVASGVKNGGATTLVKGTPVYQTSTSGNNAVVEAADASNAATMPAIGVLAQDLTAGQEVDNGLIHLGFIQGVDTSTFSEGDTIYVASGGGYTNTAPSGEGNSIQNLGKVLKVHASNGSGIVMGAGRSNATPNLNDGNVFIGNASNQAEARALVIADTTGLQTALDGKEPTFAKNTGFNKNLGTGSGDVAEGNHNHSGVYEPADATILKDADIGSTVQAYDADTAKTDVANTFTATQSFGDNVKAQFGASDDLQIYHSGTNSYIKDSGTGDLMLQGVNVRIQGATTGNNMFVGLDNGSSTLLYQNNAKLATTSTGINVTGTVSATTVDLGNWTITESSGVLYFATSGTNKMKLDASGNLTVTGNVTGYGTI